MEGSSKVVRLGPGDSFGTLSLLTGMHTEDVTLTAITSGLLLEGDRTKGSYESNKQSKHGCWYKSREK
jgi:hypothetical protein